MIRVRHDSLDGWLRDLRYAVPKDGLPLEVRLTTVQLPHVDVEVRAWPTYVVAGFVQGHAYLIDLAIPCGTATGENLASIERVRASWLDRIRRELQRLNVDIRDGRYETVAGPLM